MGKPPQAYTAHGLSQLARDILLDHVDRGRYVDAPTTTDISRRVAVNRLIKNGLITVAVWSHKRPKATMLTEDGQAVLQVLLADYAMALLRAARPARGQVSPHLAASLAEPLTSG